MKEGEKFKSKLDERKNIDDGNLVIGKESLLKYYFIYRNEIFKRSLILGIS